MASGDLPSDANDSVSHARLELVEEHVCAENDHDLEGIMATFGDAPWHEDASQEEHHDDREGVRAYYETLLRAVPDLQIDVQRRHVAAEHVILEVVISGTHIGAWRGLPGTGRQVEFPVCAVFAFDEQDRLAGERIFYDRATVLRQLGIFHEPDRGIGRLLTPLTHPLTIGRALVRMLRRA